MFLVCSSIGECAAFYCFVSHLLQLSRCVCCESRHTQDGSCLCPESLTFLNSALEVYPPFRVCLLISDKKMGKRFVLDAFKKVNGGRKFKYNTTSVGSYLYSATNFWLYRARMSGILSESNWLITSSVQSSRSFQRVVIIYNELWSSSWMTRLTSQWSVSVSTTASHIHNVLCASTAREWENG